MVAKFLKQRLDKLQYLALKDTELAEKQLIRYEQRRCLPKLYDALTTGKSLAKLDSPTASWKNSPLPWNNLIVMENRQRNAPVTSGVKYPILLPRNSHLTELIVEQMHEACGHGGVNHVFSELRQRFWVEKGSSTTRKVISDCLQCRKHKAKTLTQKMANLPPARMQIFEPAFTHSGVHYYGPF